jgi:hypothetical protein
MHQIEKKPPVLLKPTAHQTTPITNKYLLLLIPL